MNKPLIRWYDLNKKNMPWRKNQDPYSIWISEVMLQQTQVRTVIPYYNRWMQAFPTIESVARAHIDRILKVWEGLGYYRRAHHIKQACEITINDFHGKIPDNKKFVLDKGDAKTILPIVVSKLNAGDQT